MLWEWDCTLERIHHALYLIVENIIAKRVLGGLHYVYQLAA